MHARMTRKLLATAAAAALLATACGGDTTDPTDPGTDPPGTDAPGTEEPEPGGEPEPVAGFDGEVIRVGFITDASGPAASNAVPATDAQLAYIEYVNEELGGIAGRYRIEPVVVDARFDLPTTLQQYNAIKDEVVMFGQIVGTSILAGVHPELERDGIVAVPSGVDINHLDMAYLAPYGMPYQLQATTLIDWYVEENGTDVTICRLIWAGSDFGEAGLDGSDHAASVHGLEYPVTATFAAADADFTTQIGQLANGGCEAVVFTGIPPHSAAVLRDAAQAGFEATWLSAGPGWHYTLAESALIDEFEARFFQAAEGPEWGDTSHPGMAAMMDVKDRYAPDALEGLYFSYGYAGGMAVVQLLERAVELGDLSRDGILAALNSIETATFDGLFADYGWGPPGQREVARVGTVFGIDRDKPFGLAAVATDYAGASTANYPTD